MSKRTWLMLACIAMAFTMAIGGTLAYLTDTDEAVNTMVMGNVDIEMNEYADADHKTTFEDGETLLPGDTLDKHVVVENIGSTDAYVRTWIALEYGKILTLNWANGVQPTNLGTANIGGVNYELYVVDYELAAGAEPYETLSSVAMSVDAGNEDVKAIGNTLDILVYTQAVQQANLSEDVKVALNTAFLEGADPSTENHPFGNVAGVGEPENGKDITDDLNNATSSTVYLNIPANTTYKYTVGGQIGTSNMGGENTTSVTIAGNGPTSVFDVHGAGVQKVTAEGDAVLVMKNLTVKDSSVSYAEDSWEYGYLEFGGKLRFENVVFDDPIMISGDAEFINCTFTGKTTEADQYGVWVDGGSASFEGCTFKGTRGLKTHEAYGSEVKSVTVNDCEFVNLTQKPGVAIGTLNADTTVSITNSQFINCQAGDQGLYIYETDTNVTTFNFTQSKNKVITEADTVKIGTAAELKAFADAVNNSGTYNSYNGKLIVLTADIDLNGATWTPIGQTGAGQFMGTFDGAGYTISNFVVDETSVSGANRAAGLFGWLNTATIKNVTVSNAKVSGNQFVGAIAGYMEPLNTCTIENCHVEKSTIYATDTKAGGIVGYANNSGNVVRNCTVVGSTVSACRDAGQVVGCAKASYVEGCSASNVAVSYNGYTYPDGHEDQGKENSNINNAVIGRVI